MTVSPTASEAGGKRRKQRGSQCIVLPILLAVTYAIGGSSVILLTLSLHRY